MRIFANISSSTFPSTLQPTKSLKKYGRVSFSTNNFSSYKFKKRIMEKLRPINPARQEKSLLFVVVRSSSRRYSQYSRDYFPGSHGSGFHHGGERHDGGEKVMSTPSVASTSVVPTVGVAAAPTEFSSFS
jgi:hypothetical protein